MACASRTSAAMPSSDRGNQETARVVAPPVVTFQRTKMRHIVGPLSPNSRGQGDLVLANAARYMRTGLGQAAAGFAGQTRGLQIGSLVHRDTPRQGHENGMRSPLPSRPPRCAHHASRTDRVVPLVRRAGPSQPAPQRCTRRTNRASPPYRACRSASRARRARPPRGGARLQARVTR
jgi:hypothetical protein